MALYQIAVIEFKPLNHHIWAQASPEQKETQSLNSFKKKYYGDYIQISSADEQKTPMEDWDVHEDVPLLIEKNKNQYDKFNPENKPEFTTVYNKLFEGTEEGAQVKKDEMLRAYKDTERVE